MINKKIIALFILLFANFVYSQCSNNILNWVQTQKQDPNRGGFGFGYGSNPYVESMDDAGGTTIATANFSSAYSTYSLTTNKLEFDLSFNDYNDSVTTELWVNGVKYMDMVVPADNGSFEDYDNVTVYAPVKSYNGAKVNGLNIVNIPESKLNGPATNTGIVKTHITLTFPTNITINSGSIQIRNVYPYFAGATGWRSQGDYEYWISLKGCMVDLFATKTDNKTEYIPGATNIYTVVVGNNNTTTGVTGATVSDPLPTGIPNANVTYTAVVSGGATTQVVGTRTGAIADIVNLPVGGKVTYTVTMLIPNSYAGNLSNIVTVTPPTGTVDSNITNNTATDTDTQSVVGVCSNPGATGIPNGYTKVGITNHNKLQEWPGNIPNGHIALESNTKGMVITRVAHVSSNPNLISDAIKDPKEGMIVYDIQDKCVKLYNGTIWNCIKNTCGPVVEPPRKIRLGSYGSWIIGGNAFPAYDSQLINPVNYGPAGTFKGITGFEFSNITSLLETTTAAQLKANYDIINGFFEKISSANAQKIADYVKLGGVAIVNIDNPQYDFSAILNSFGITGPYSNYGGINAQSSVTNQLSNVFGDTKNIALLGSDTQGRIQVSQLPSESIIYANEMAAGGGVAVWTIGGDFKGKVIFVWDEGIFRTPISGTVIDTPQEKFVHNLMAYALEKLGFQP